MSGRHRKPPPARAGGRHRRLPPQSHRQPPQHHLLAPALAGVVLLSAGGVAAAAAFSGGPDPAQPHVPTIVLGTSFTSPTPPATPSTHPPSSPHRHAPALALAVTGRVSWVEAARPSGRLLYSGLARHGRDIVVRRGPVRVVIGDAAAVRVSRNGRPGRAAGKPGRVVVVRVR